LKRAKTIVLIQDNLNIHKSFQMVEAGD